MDSDFEYNEFTILPKIIIKQNDCNIQPKRQLGIWRTKKRLSELPGKFIQLKEIYLDKEYETIHENHNKLPYVDTTNLKHINDTDPVLNYNDKSLYEKEWYGKLVKRDIILFRFSNRELFITLLKTDDHPVLVDNFTHFYEFDTTKVDLDYLIWELRSPFVMEQFKYLSRGENDFPDLKKDFLEIFISFPSLDDQIKRGTELREKLYLNRLNRLDEYALSEDLKMSSNNKVLAVLRHELAPLSSNIKTNIYTLYNFLQRTVEKGKVPEFTDPVSRLPGSMKLEEIFDFIQLDADNINTLTRNLKNIITANKEDLNLREVNIADFLRKSVDEFGLADDFDILGVVSDEPEILMQIDLGQMRILTDNFLKNTLIHGYEDLNENPERQKIAVIKISEESKSKRVFLDLYNNGKSFPVNFSFREYIQIGEHAGNGSGIGGYLISKIILNHRGSFEKIDAEAEITVNIKNKHSKEIGEIIKFKPGVHFRIGMPKKL